MARVLNNHIFRSGQAAKIAPVNRLFRSGDDAFHISVIVSPHLIDLRPVVCSPLLFSARQVNCFSQVVRLHRNVGAPITHGFPHGIECVPNVGKVLVLGYLSNKTLKQLLILFQRSKCLLQRSVNLRLHCTRRIVLCVRRVLREFSRILQQVCLRERMTCTTSRWRSRHVKLLHGFIKRFDDVGNAAINIAD